MTLYPLYPLIVLLIAGVIVNYFVIEPFKLIINIIIGVTALLLVLKLVHLA